MRDPVRVVVILINALLGTALAAAPALAQQTLSGWTIAGDSQVQIGENEFALNGNAEIEQGDTKLYADHVDFFPDQDRAIATGNVLFSQGNNRIGADTADFNTRTRLGTFYHAYGIASIQPPRRPVTASPAGGAAAPQLAPTTNQPTDVYFFGDIVEKVGPKKYRISNGGFSTCVQPTPRWDLSASTVILNVNHYTRLTNAVFRVKGVPLLYLPFLYYPTKEDQRATGLLIPTYGVDTLYGQSIHNAFFWAIDRSQDATITHDWYSKGDQGIGTEYRYNFGGGMDGAFAGHFLNQRADASTGLPAERSFTLIGTANQLLPDGFRARINANYFSSLSTNQTVNMDVDNASQNTRQYGVNVVRSWRTYSLNATYSRTESFYDSTDSTVSGSTPIINLNRNERPLTPRSPIYFSLSSQFANLESGSKTAAEGDQTKSVSRFDISPQLRYPFKKWPFFTVNSSFQWRDTYYTRSLDSPIIDPTTEALTPSTTEVNQGLNRQYFVFQAQAVGPVFNRIWDTPNNRYATRFKHTIEPTFTLQRISNIDDTLRARIIQSDGTDYQVGGTTNVTYGVNNRFYAKRRAGQGSQSTQSSAPLEFLTISLSQTYYTNKAASQYDTGYQTGTATPASNFSPVKLDVRAQPTTSISATSHAEVDSHYKKLRQLTANSTYSWTGRLQTTVGWTRTFLIPELLGFNDPSALTDYLNVSTNAQTRDNKVGVRYTVYYDIMHSMSQQQRISLFYNAQCCGIAAEYQTYNLSGISSITGLTSDHRFFLSLTLAGLGNFSPFNGGMSQVPH